MWEPKDPAGGNNPHVDFQPSPMAQEVTVTPAKWYASPDDECGAKAEATYLLNAKVFFNGDEFETEMAQMTVFLDRRGGVTSAPDIAGFPGIVAIRDNRGDVVKVKVDNIGTLRRIDPKAKIFPSQSSQFYEKIKAHEEAHVEQFKTGIARDLWSVDALFKRLRNLDAVSEMLLEQKVNAEIGKFKKEQIDSFNKLWDKMQVEAYSISDPMPPRYFYQRCGRTTFPKL